jgi:hypothetical protein
MPKLSLPPAQGWRSAVRRCDVFVGQYVTDVSLNQIGKRAALGFSGLEVSAFEGYAFSHLCPCAGVAEFRDGRCL